MPVRTSRVHQRASWTVVVAIALLAGLIPVGPASAAEAPDLGGGLPGLDVRRGIASPPGPDQLATVASLGAVARWSQHGAPLTVIRHGAHLSGPAEGDPLDIARGFISAHPALFGLDAAAVSRLEGHAFRTSQNGAAHVRFPETHDGLEVYGADLQVSLDELGRVLIAGGTWDTALTVATTPVVGAARAVRIAADSVKAPGREERLKRTAGPEGRSRLTTFANTLAHPAMRAGVRPVTAELVVFPMPATQADRLAWKVQTEVMADGDYTSLVDAVTGQLLYRQNAYMHSGPVGLVHTGDDPEAGGQVTVPFTGLGTWVDGRSTRGDHTIAYQDLFNDNTAHDADMPQTPDTPDPAYQHFNYTFTNAWSTSAGTDVATDRDAVVTQLFYYTNWFHDYAHGLGFDAAAGNFEGGDPVLAESDNGYGTGTEMLCTNSAGNPIRCRNNANFNTQPDGTSSRMQMFVGEAAQSDGTTRYTQRSNNRDTVIHEYTHGISGRLIANGNMPNGAQSRALGEGWSDALAISINNDPVYGEYNNGNNTTGIRNVAYNNSTLVYSQLCTRDSAGCQEHTDGEIWASTMWDQRTALRGRHGAAGGKSRHEFLMVEGMKQITASVPTYLDARDGILAADTATYGGANQCLLWRSFASREMGLSAATASQSVVTAATDGPAACLPTASIGGPYNTIEGTDVGLDASGSTTGGDPGDTLSYAWDLDNDGQYDDASSAKPNFTRVGRDGTYTIRLRVTNSSGWSADATTTVNVSNVAPTVGLVGSAPVDEGSQVTIGGVVSDAGWLDPLSATIDWKDGSGIQSLSGSEEHVRPDGTITFNANHTFGNNGLYPVEVCGSDDDTTTCASVNVQVDNVAPTVTIDPNQLTDIVEGDSVTVKATFTDPGWLDTYTSTIDWGTGASEAGTPTVTTQGPPADVGEVTGTLQYGDDGSFTVTIDVTDDDGGTGSDSTIVTVSNVDPTATVDTAGATDVNGTPTVISQVGETVNLSADSTDPGSDDLTTSWDFDDGAPSPDDVRVSLVNPPNPDTFPSPTVQPRDVTHGTANAFGDACLYDVGFASADDDGGSAADGIAVVIQGDADRMRPSGYWQHQYGRNGRTDFTDDELACYLAITGFMSTVFDEARDASTIEAAFDVLFLGNNGGSASEKLDRELLTAWLNFANGAIAWDDLVDTDGNVLPDDTFAGALAAAEAVRNDAGASAAELGAARQRLHRINSKGAAV